MRLNFDLGRWRGLVVAGVGVALVLQLLAAAYVNRPWLPIDTLTYLDLSKSLAQGSFALPTPFGIEPTSYRAPGFPMFLYTTLDLLRLPLTGVLVLYGLAYLYCIWTIAQTVFASDVQRLVFALLAVVYVFTAVYVMMVATEGLALLLITTMTVKLTTPRLDWRTLAIVGLLGGLASLVRPDSLPLLVLPAILVLWRAWRSGTLTNDPAPVLGRALIGLLVSLVVLSPFALWNLSTFGTLTPLPAASMSGKSLYIATWDGVLPLEDLGPLQGTASDLQPPSARAVAAGLTGEMTAMERAASAAGAASAIQRRYPGAAHEIALNKQFSRMARTRIHRAPGQYAGHLVRGTWNLWNTQEYPAALPAIAKAMLRLLSGGVFLLAVIGAGIALVEPRTLGVSRVPLLMIAAFAAIHLPLHTEARYTAPVRLLMLIYAAAVIAWLVNRLCARFVGANNKVLPPAVSPAH